MYNSEEEEEKEEEEKKEQEEEEGEGERKIEKKNFICPFKVSQSLKLTQAL